MNEEKSPLEMLWENPEYKAMWNAIMSKKIKCVFCKVRYDGDDSKHTCVKKTWRTTKAKELPAFLIDTETVQHGLD